MPPPMRRAVPIDGIRPIMTPGRVPPVGVPAPVAPAPIRNPGSPVSGPVTWTPTAPAPVAPLPTTPPGFRDTRGTVIQGPSPTTNALQAALKQSWSPDAQKLQRMAMTGLSGLSSAPDRAQLAAQALKLQREMTQPAWEQDLRRTGQMAAALGRTGSGMTTNELTDLTLARERSLGQYGQQAALDAASQEMADRLGIFDRTAGYGGQVAGQDLARAGFGQSVANSQFSQGMQRAGLATQQQGFQQQMAQQAIDNARQQQLLQDQLLNSQFGRQLSAAQAAGQYGYAGDPYGMQLQGAGMQQQNAAAQQAALAQQAQAEAMRRALASYGG